jgi:hypothetical protein
MAMSGEVQASIIRVAGEWAIAMACTPEGDGEPIQPSQMSYLGVAMCCLGAFCFVVVA